MEKAAEKVGYGLAMAEDVAGTVKTAVGAAVTTVTNVLTPAKKAPKRMAKKAVAKSAAKRPRGEGCQENCSQEVAGQKDCGQKASKKSVKTPQRKLSVPGGDLKQVMPLCLPRVGVCFEDTRE